MKELLLFVCLMIGHSFGISEQKVVKSGRLFSNPFGILGHEACPTTLKGRNVTGICYNEMECLLRLVLDIFSKWQSYYLSISGVVCSLVIVVHQPSKAFVASFLIQLVTKG